VSTFIHPALKQLTDQQVRFAPAARRQEQIVRAEKLLAEVQPDRTYPYTFICYRITDYRSDATADTLIPGTQLSADLRLFIRRLERSLPALPIEEAIEPMLSLEEVSKRFNVSTKTISRWRVRGLVGQRIIKEGRRQIAFQKSVVEQFISSHGEVAEKGSKFSHMSEAEKELVLRRARRLSQAGGSLTEVSRRIAKRISRSVETIRYTIKNFDRDHPTHALYPTVTGPLDPGAKEMIYNAYRRGTTVEQLAKKYSRTNTSIYRVIHEVQAEKVKSQPLDYIFHESFNDSSNEAEFLAGMPDQDKFDSDRSKARIPKDVPAELAHLYQYPLLSKPQEQHLFRQMNFLKHKLHLLRESINVSAARVQELKEIEALQERIQSVKELLVNCNLRLVVNYAKKHNSPIDNLFELISDGNISLLRAVDKFDYSRGNKFSTYASWAIMKNFARSIPDEKTYRERYMTGHEEMFESRADNRTDEQECLSRAELARGRINELLKDLDPRTRDVIRMRAGLDGSEEMTLEQIGQHFGITKERVRQINVRGMKQLREKAMANKIDLP